MGATGLNALDSSAVYAATGMFVPAKTPVAIVNRLNQEIVQALGVLSRNEVERDYAYNRALFMRVAQGWYQFNPKLSVRRRQGDEELWTPIYAALNLPLINEFSRDDGWESVWDRIAEYLAMAGLPERTIPIAAERAVARQEALDREREKHEAEERAALERWRKEQAATLQRQQAENPKWGTPEAKRMEIERIRREIEERNKH